MTRPLLVLRPEPGCTRTVAAAHRLGLDALPAPLFEIEPLDWRVPDGAHDALLLTSANALLGGLPDTLLDLPALAVGERTADAAAERGLSVTLRGTSDAAALVKRARAAGYRRLLHLAGRERSLRAQPDITVVETYLAAPLPPPILPGKGVALLHSARAARRFAELVAERAAFALVAISAPVLSAAGTGWHQGTAAPEPTDAAMLAMAARLCKGEGDGVATRP